jgi:hypothetical protein
VLAVLYVIGANHLQHFLASAVFTSFRISGTYELRAVSVVWWNGTDCFLISSIIAMAISLTLSIAHQPSDLDHALASR